MAVLTVQKILETGITPSFAAAAAGGDSFENLGDVLFWVKNGGGGSVTVTIDALTACSRGFDHNGGGSVGAGADGVFGPFPPNIYNDANHRAAVTYSGVSSVTVAALRLPKQ